MSVAARDSQTDVVKLLLASGASAYSQGWHKENALQATAAGRFTTLVHLLCDNGDDLNDEFCDLMAVCAAASNDRRDVVQYLKKREVESSMIISWAPGAAYFLDAKTLASPRSSFAGLRPKALIAMSKMMRRS